MKGWFFRKYWRREYGSKWNERFCMDWFERESQEDRFAITLFRCPCTMAQSELDRGRFSPDQQCNVIDKKCDARHHGAQHCVRTSRPSSVTARLCVLITRLVIKTCIFVFCIESAVPDSSAVTMITGNSYRAPTPCMGADLRERLFTANTRLRCE
jgi:hypothetical protein